MFTYHQKTLDNGLRVGFVPMDLTSVVVNLYVEAGSKFEKENEHGLAHFFEHMAFKGTEKRPDKLTLAKQLDKIGAVYNAGTAKEYISYWIKNTAKHLDLMFDVVSDLVFNPKFPEIEIEIEKGVILEEINMYEDSPSSKIAHNFRKLIFGDTLLGRETLGTKESVTGFNRDEFLEYRGRLYSPDKMVLAVAGRTEKDRVFKLAEEWFGKYESFSTQTDRVDWKSMSDNVFVEEKKTEQTHLILGRPIFGLKDKRRWPMSLLRTVLGEGMSSRLWNEVREKRGLAYYVYANTGYYQEAGLFAVGAGVRNEKAREAVQIIKKELLKIGQTITEEELNDAKEGIRGRILLSVESTNNLADWAASTWLKEGRVRSVKQTLDRIESVTIDEVKQLAEEIFQPESFYLAAIGPSSKLSL